MIDRRGSRFAFEALFLVALAVGLALADVRPLVIVGVMALGWVLVAAVEWAAWRGEPHYGSGLPPRYYVPRVSLPPAQPLEQVRVGYPEAQREEAPTWIASPALRAEVLGEWPVATAPPGEDTQEAAPTDEPTEDAEPEVVELDEAAPAGAAEPRRRRLWGSRKEHDEAADPWTVAEVPVEPEEPPAGPEAAGEPSEEQLVDLAPTAQRTARHRLDPLPEPSQKRRLRRRREEPDGPAVEVPARPSGVRVLPGRSRGED